MATRELSTVENALVAEVYRADGSLAERYLGPSEKQLKHEHDTGQCGAMCGYCYHEAAEWLASQ